MTPIIDLLTDYGGVLLAGSTVLLGIGTIATAILGRPVERQRLGELTLLATIAWLLLACVPLPRWEIGAPELPAPSEGEMHPIAVLGGGAPDAPDEPSSNLIADAAVDAIPFAAGFEGTVNAADGIMDVQTPSSKGYLGASSVVPALEPTSTTKGPTAGWRRILAASYAAGLLGCIVWLLTGHVLLARSQRIATAPDKWLQDLYESVASGRRAKRASLLVSSACRRPAVYGLWRPVIILPRDLCRPENSEQLRHVLRHESAHVWRGDARGNLIMNAAFPFLFFHPLYWWIRHRIQFSRELIADDWAAGLSSKESYADELVQLVSQGREMRLGTIGVLGVFRFNTPFYRRMKMLIDRRQPLATTLPLTGKCLGILAGVTVVAAMACVAGVPRATAEGGPPAAEGEPVAVANEQSLATADAPAESGQAAASSEMHNAMPAEPKSPQPVEEAIRDALKSVPGATIQISRDPKTGNASVTVGVPANYFDKAWINRQKKTRADKRRSNQPMGGAGMMMGGAMEESRGGQMAVGGGMMGTGGMDGGEAGMGMGGMDMGMGMEMGMGMGGGVGSRIPRDQLQKFQVEEADSIRDAVAASLQKIAQDAIPVASVNVSVVREIRLDSSVVKLIDEVMIPAYAEGPVVEWAVRQGDRVERGQLLARIDDRRARLKLDEAKGRLEDAQGNDVNVKYAEAALHVANADYESALEANQANPGALTNSEMRRLALAVDQYKLQVEQAQMERAGTRAQKAQLALAESELSNYRADAPLDGIVVEVFPQIGEWVRTGDPICHIVRMSRLQVEARLDVNRHSPDEVRSRDVIIEFTTPRGEVQRLPGKVTFVSPLVEADSRCKVVAEITNREKDGQYLLKPGTRVAMIVKLILRPGAR